MTEQKSSEAERRANALRANLRRRKQQARTRAQTNDNSLLAADAAKPISSDEPT